MVDDIFSEVDDDLRAERLRARTRRLAAVGLAALLVAALVFAAWEWIAARQHARAVAVSAQFFAAQKDADTAPAAAAGPDAPPTPEQMRAIGEFAQVAAHGPAGVATLSRLRMATLQWAAHDHAGALALWDQVSRDGVDPDLRGLGQLLWVQHSADDADPGVLKTRLRDILVPASPWHLLALETDALIDLRLGHVADARAKLTRIGEDGSASESERARASGILDTLDTSKTGG